jgi:hypothetical protein
LVLICGLCNLLLIALPLNLPVQAQEKCDQISPLDDPDAKPPRGADPEYWKKQLRMCRKVVDELKKRASLSASELKKLPPFPFSYAAIENCRDQFAIPCHRPKIPPTTYNLSGPWLRAIGMSTPAPPPVSMPTINTEPRTPPNSSSQINPPRFSSRLITP